MSDKIAEDEEWKPMDLGTLRKFVREDIPVRPSAKKSGDEVFSDIYVKKNTEEENFKPFMDLGEKPVLIKRREAKTIIPGEVFDDDIEESSLDNKQESTEAEAGNKEAETVSQPESQLDEKALEEAYARASEDGYAAGFARGQEEGFTSGREEGLLQGSAEAYEKGLEEGRLAGREEMDAGISQLAELLASFKREWPLILKNYEREIVSLSMEIAEALIYGVLPLDSSIVERSILSALNELPDPLKVKLSVNPEDFQHIEMIKNSFFEKIPELRELELSSDPGILPGGCRLSSSSGSIRAELDERIRVLRETLLLAVDSSRS